MVTLMRSLEFAAKIAVALVLKNRDITGLHAFCFLAPSMPGIRLSMPPEFAGCDIVARAASGPLAVQRAALAALMEEAGWDTPTKEETGRPRLGEDHCSLDQRIIVRFERKVEAGVRRRGRQPHVDARVLGDEARGPSSVG